MIVFKIPIQNLKQSTNKIYAGQHWAKRKEFKDSVLGYAAVFCRKSKAVEFYPVQIRYRFVFESRPLDTLNCAYLAKAFEDAFRALKILEDDDYTHVARSILEVTRPADQAGPGHQTSARSRLKAGRKNQEDWLEVEISSFIP